MSNYPDLKLRVFQEPILIMECRLKSMPDKFFR
jgi:hypothetical protein